MSAATQLQGILGKLSDEDIQFFREHLKIDLSAPATGILITTEVNADPEVAKSSAKVLRHLRSIQGRSQTCGFCEKSSDDVGPLVQSGEHSGPTICRRCAKDALETLDGNEEEC